MNELQKLLKLRGLTIREVARRTGNGYHITQKVIKGTSINLKQGGTYIYRSRSIETAVAKLLGLSHSQAWGPKSSIILRHFIRLEIKKHAKRSEQEMQKQWLTDSRIAEKQATGNV